MTAPQSISDILDRLAERVEAATGPDRELDALIAIASGVEYRSRRTAGGKNKGREWFLDSHGGVQTWAHHPPAYTSSLDAAMTLVPEGYIYGQGTAFASAWAWCGEDKGSGINCQHQAKASTPALALTAACLRARSAAAASKARADGGGS